MATKKLLRGLKNIHFANWNGSTFEQQFVSQMLNESRTH